MAKTRARKESDLNSYVDSLKEANALVFADLSSLKVNENTEFRQKALESEVKITSSKKTLLHRAIKDIGLEGVDEAALKNGAVYLLAAHGDQIAPAKLVAELKKKHENVIIQGGILDNAWLSAEQVVALSKLPSKEQLIAQVVGSIRAPLSGMVGVLQGNLRGLVQVLNAYKEAKA
jgi:large subunit ribosomal protein L10